MTRRRPIDWQRVILEIRGSGMSLHGISAALGKPIATVHGWQSLDAEPRHSDGEALLELWASRKVANASRTRQEAA